MIEIEHAFRAREVRAQEILEALAGVADPQLPPEVIPAHLRGLATQFQTERAQLANTR